MGTRGAASDPFIALRLDRIDSRGLLRDARHIYFRFLENGYGPTEPLGVVIGSVEGAGRVVFDLPVLLPDECFVPLELLRLRPNPRNRSPRAQTSRGPTPLPERPLRATPPARAAGDV